MVSYQQAYDARKILKLGNLSDFPASGFAALRWQPDNCRPEFWCDGWHELAVINGIDVDLLVNKAAEMEGRDWQRLLICDLAGVLSQYAVPVENWDILSSEGAKFSLTPTTANLLSSIWFFLQYGECPPLNAEPDMQEALKALEEIHLDGSAQAPKVLSAEQMESDLLLLDRLIKSEFSYWWISTSEYSVRQAQMLAEIRQSGANRSRIQHVEAMRDLMALLGDAHTRVNSADCALVNSGIAPLQFDWIKQKLVAVSLDRRSLIEPEYPFVTAIAGVPIKEWKRVAGGGVPRGTSSMRRTWMAREIRRIGALAGKLNVVLPDDMSVTVTFTNESGSATKDVILALLDHDPKPEIEPVQGGIIAGNIGYIALPAGMVGEPEAIAAAHTLMRSFEATDGIIIDIRDNGGGSRHLLQAIIGYLVPKNKAYVTSWARIRRMPGGDPEAGRHIMQKRLMRPSNSTEWSGEAQTAAADFMAQFVPEWPAAENENFGPLNLLMAERLPEHGDLHLAQPVAQLINLRNYSASDIFASSIAALPQVRSFGTPTAGGSGFVRRTILPASGTEIQISTMASGMINGDLYERRGVCPEEIIEPSLSQWKDGSDADPVLQRAVSYLKSMK
ncbi:S41 family peptidase [Paenochrobactrum glaciei]|uniref:Tail specific protease domain-containing protein n=1 Tax=Paenochrobactrum glaciei TaxID=486407 RepID=A0ABP3RWV1_9HYPH